MTSDVVVRHGEIAAGAELAADSLLRDWREIVALRRSAQQFNGRLMRTAPLVAELAASYPGLRDAVKVVNVLVANVALADDVLGRVPIPMELVEEAE
jgi:hypothetical protein